MSAIMATKPSVSMAPKPMTGMSRSDMIIFGVVPDEMREWNPDMAPQAMVMNMKGKSLPGITGPPPPTNRVMAGIWITGAIKRTPIARRMTVPIFI